jgi:hypothetical protein
MDLPYTEKNEHCAGDESTERFHHAPHFEGFAPVTSPVTNSASKHFISL